MVKILVTASFVVLGMVGQAHTQPQLDCRQRALAAMDEGQLSIRTDGGAMLAVIAPAFWPADAAARDTLVNDLDCSVGNFGATGTFVVVEEGSDKILAVKQAGQITFPQ